jgi:hypothetical protein
VIEYFSSLRECQDVMSSVAAHAVEPIPYGWRTPDTIAKKHRKLQNLNTNNLQLQAWEG